MGTQAFETVGPLNQTRAEYMRNYRAKVKKMHGGEQSRFMVTLREKKVVEGSEEWQAALARFHAMLVKRRAGMRSYYQRVNKQRRKLKEHELKLLDPQEYAFRKEQRQKADTERKRKKRRALKLAAQEHEHRVGMAARKPKRKSKISQLIEDRQDATLWIYHRLLLSKDPVGRRAGILWFRIHANLLEYDNDPYIFRHLEKPDNFNPDELNARLRPDESKADDYGRIAKHLRIKPETRGGNRKGFLPNHLR